MQRCVLDKVFLTTTEKKQKMFAMFKSYNNIYKKKTATKTFIIVLKMHTLLHTFMHTLCVGGRFTIKTNIQLSRMLKLVPLRFLSFIVCVWMIKLFNRIPNSIKYPFSSSSSSSTSNNNNKNSSFLFSHFEKASEKSVISFVIFLNPKMLTMCPQNRSVECSQ